MKKTMLRIASVISLLAVGLSVQAQNVNLLGGRFIVNAAAPAGGKVATYEVANDGSGDAQQWGRAIDSIWFEVPLAKALANGTDDPTLGCGDITSDVAGKFALVRRGDCSFTQKAAEAQSAGAIGVIIANHTAGAGVAGMAFSEGFGDISIPVIMVTKELGDDLYAALDAGEAVTVSLSRWSFGFDNDLTFINQSTAMFHAMGIPYRQLADDNGNPAPYNQYLSALVANTGNMDQSGIVLSSKVTFTPTGGSSYLLTEDSLVIDGAFDVNDSILVFTKLEDAAQIHVNTTGNLDITYTVHGDEADEYPADNTESATVMVTDNIFSKGRLNPVTMEPVVKSGVKFSAASGGSDMVWGPMYYVAKGGDTVKQVQFAVYGEQPDSVSLVDKPNVTCRIYSWVDANADGVMTVGELTQKGIGVHSFTTADSNGNVLSLNITEDDGVSPVLLEDNTWYYVALEVSNELYVGHDVVNYYTRMRSSAFNDANTEPGMEFLSAQFSATSLTNASPGDTLTAIPFLGDNAASYDITQFGFSSADYIPVAVLKLGMSALSVGNAISNFNEVAMFPNPVRNELTVSVKLANKAEKLQYRITDVMGRTIQAGNVYDVQDTKFSISTSFLASGNYYLVMTDGKQTYAKKFVKEGK